MTTPSISTTELSARLAQAAMDSGAGVEASLLLGEARFRSGHAAEAESVLARAAGLCRTDHDVARIANARAYNLFNSLDAAAAASVLDDALAVITEKSPRLLLLGRLATNRIMAGDPEGALAAAAPLLANDDHAIFGKASYVSSIALAFTGRADEAVALADEGLRRYRQASGVPQLPEVQLIGRVFAHAAAGRLAQAQADAATGEQACLAAGDLEGHATGLFMTGLVLIERGHLGRAASMFRDGASVNRNLNELAALRWCLSGVALAEAMGGHADEARAAALAAGNAAELDAAGRAFAAMGASLLAAEAYTAASAGYRSDGLARLASAAGRKAEEMAAACGDVRPPTLAMSGSQDGLTRREREVAGLAATGASSREIAAELYLSVRTVDNHLQNVYGKLGITSREELTRILGS